MSRPRYKLSKFQIVGNEEGMAVADCEIIYDGKTIPLKKHLRRENKHDVDLLLAIDKFICKENFNQSRYLNCGGLNNEYSNRID